MGRQPCCDKIGLKRGPWTIEEDHKLMNFIINNGIHCWRSVPKLAGLLRCGKSCKLRWINYRRPDLKRGDFTEIEENQLIQLHSLLGNRWSKIAAHFSGRTDNEIKNHWNTRIKKRLKQLGLDPITHKPIEKTILEPSKNVQNEEKKKEVEGKNEKIKEEETNDILKKYEVFYGSLEMESYAWMNEEMNNNNNNSCSSFSQENIQHNNDCVDSILSWDFFNYLEDDIFFL